MTGWAPGGQRPGGWAAGQGDRAERSGQGGNGGRGRGWGARCLEPVPAEDDRAAPFVARAAVPVWSRDGQVTATVTAATTTTANTMALTSRVTRRRFPVRVM